MTKPNIKKQTINPSPQFVVRKAIEKETPAAAAAEQAPRAPEQCKIKHQKHSTTAQSPHLLLCLLSQPHPNTWLVRCGFSTFCPRHRIAISPHQYHQQGFKVDKPPSRVRPLSTSSRIDSSHSFILKRMVSANRVSNRQAHCDTSTPPLTKAPTHLIPRVGSSIDSSLVKRHPSQLSC